jgi:hypothetical protein
MNIFEKILNHKNKRYLLQEILNETAYFLCESLYQIGLWKNPKEAGENLKKIVETYLSTQRRIEYEHLQKRKTLKEFLSDEETATRTMDYLVKTLTGGNSSLPEINVISLWIALDEKEEEFNSFYEELKKEEPLSIGEALTAYWLYYSYLQKKIKELDSEKEDFYNDELSK